MQNLLQQIEKFWTKQTRPTDEEVLLKVLHDKKVTGELQAHLRGEFEQAVEQSSDHVAGSLSRKQQKRIWHRLRNIEESENVTSKGSRSKKGRIYAILVPVAACLVLAIGGGICYYLWAGRVADHQTTGVIYTQPEKQLVTLTNTTAKDKRLILPDRSTVILAPESTIYFLDSFTTRARAVTLTGKALFKVTRDTRRPFTVKAGGLTTTALGTAFMVDSRKGTLCIQLLEGKIAIAPTPASKIKMQTVYLHPGEQLRLNSRTHQYWSGKTTPEKVNRDLPKPQADNTDNQEGLSFNKSGLATVFQTLARQYHIKIIYDKSVIQGLSFTGSFKKSDSLEVVLNIVCSINGLSCEKKAEGFVVHP